MTEIVSIGEVLIDLTQAGVNSQGIPLFAANPGGSCSNLAVAAARLGAKVSFVGKVGPDGFGSSLVQVLEENRVDVSGVRVGTKPTTLAIASVDDKGERDFAFVRGADCDLALEELDLETIFQTRFLHFSSVCLSAGASREATLAAAHEAHRRGVLVSYDPNYRPPLWTSRGAALFWMGEPLGVVDLLKVSEEELPLLTGGIADLEEGTAFLAEKGISLQLVTLGSQGVYYRWKGQSGRLPGYPVTVADTIGAGDTFLGAVLSRLARRGEKPLDGLEQEELEAILDFANRAASIACSRSGGIPSMPSLAEVEAGLPNGKKG